jgi:sigma-B regulation protein RsbU (phosphoserine phosphatase)
MDQSISAMSFILILTQQEALRTLQAGAGAIVLGSIILVAGLFALSVYFIRPKPRAGLLLWFGMIALLYGVRLLLSTPAIGLLIEQPEEYWRYSVSFINYAILIPFVLFMMELYGKGWKSSFRVLLWIQILYAFAAILTDILNHTPDSLPDPVYLFFLGVAVIQLLGRFHGYRPPLMEETREIKIGLFVFILSVINEHLVGFSLVPWTIRLEALCFFLLVILLGYITVRRFLRNEQKLLAIQHEMEAARQIQASILPGETPRLNYCKMVVKYLPMASVAGDFYDFVTTDKNGLGVFIADVAGHGVPAALVASMLKVALQSQSSSFNDPAAVLGGLNRIFCRQVTGKFVTAGYLLIEPVGGTAIYSGAAHPPLLLWRAADNKVIEHEDNGLLLGFRPEEQYSNIRFKLSSGDRIFLYTDGIIEVMDPSGDLFGRERFNAFIESRSQMPLELIADSLIVELDRWSGGKSGVGYDDDLTLLILEVGELGGSFN